MVEFVNTPNRRVFILRGYAGTGKTTMMRVFIDHLNKTNVHYRLLASTGRAAKILNNVTGCDATTVHGLIYKFKDINANIEDIVNKREAVGVDSTGQLFLKFDLTTVNDDDEETCYIVDEASMVSDNMEKQSSQALFGSGRLLSDLLTYDPRGKFIFVGDSCQLPPVNQKMSPALNVGYFKEIHNIDAEEIELTEVLRQANGNDIVHSAKKIRQLYHNPQPWKWAKFPMKGYRNIKIVPSQAKLMELYVRDAKENGFNEATMLCYSNSQSNTLTNIVRPQFGKLGATLQTGDLLLVTQNNLVSGLLNGDLVVVSEIGERTMRAGLTFLKVSLKELSSDRCYSQYMIEEILYQNATNITQEQQTDLYIDFFIRIRDKGFKQRTKAFEEMMRKDPYLNALRAVYGYALTCHKSQGGEWDRVYLDIPRNLPLVEKPYVYQWMYTAMTRASAELYIIDDFWIL
jgi:hypothetical protein